MSTRNETPFEEAEKLIDQRRLLPAVQTLEQVREITNSTGERAFATYNLGIFHWQFLGDGLSARREFLAAIALLDEHGYGQMPILKTLHASALENAMLCALSFEEFEDLASRLARLTPGVPILTGLLPQMRDMRERGQPWSDCLFYMAGTYYNRSNSKLDAGLYGRAKATYHLLLVHRVKLRLSREDWGNAVFETCALSMRMVSDYMIIRGGDNDPHSPEEYLPVLTEAMSLVDEYLAVNPANEAVNKARLGMDQITIHCRQRWDAQNERINSMPQQSKYQVCQKCGTVFSRLDIDGPGSMMFGTDNLLSQTKMCPKCGGKVVWKSSPQIDSKFGCAWPVVIVIIGLLIWLAINWIN